MFKNGFNSWTLHRRLSIIVLISVFAIIIFITASLFLFHRYNQITSRMTAVEMNVANNLSHSFHEMTAIHAQLFSYIHYAPKVMRSMGDESGNGKIVTRFDKLLERIKVFQGDAQQKLRIEDSKRAFAEILQRMQQYRRALITSIEMAVAKPDLSHKHFVEATERFNQINKLVSEVSNRISFYADLKIKEEIDAANKLFWSLGLTILVVICFLIWFAYDLAATLSGQFNVVGGALEQLRDGDTQITLPDYPADSEMGSIVKSIERFKKVLDDINVSQSSLYRKNQQLQEEGEQRIIIQQELKNSLRDLNKAIGIAETSNEMKNHFLGNISYELRTQLNGVIGVTELLLEEPLEEKQHNYVQTIYNVGAQLLLILNNILDYSRIETNQFTLQYSPFSLKELLDNLIPIFKDKAFAKKIELNVTVSPDVPDENYGDPNRIRQILFNLIHNAIKFTEFGKVEVNVTKGSKEQVGKKVKQNLCPWDGRTLSSDCNWHVLSFEITDTGVGIPIQKQEHLFANILHHDESISAESCDTGFGLAIVKQLVDLMDGEVGIESEFYKRTRVWFRICLPCSIEE